MPKGIYIRKDTSKMGKYQRTPEILAKYKTGLFKKNQVAYNKGKKGLPPLSPQTTFKKGNIPCNTLPVGSFRIVTVYIGKSIYSFCT